MIICFAIIGLVSMWSLTKHDNNKLIAKNRAFNGISGWCSSLKELLYENQFMKDFHDAFNIEEVPFSIRDMDSPVTKSLMMDIVANVLQVCPIKIYIAKYDKSINLNEINKKYILACADSHKCADDDRDIYIVGCDIDPLRTYANYKYGSKENMENRLKELGFN